MSGHSALSPLWGSGLNTTEDSGLSIFTDIEDNGSGSGINLTSNFNSLCAEDSLGLLSEEFRADDAGTTAARVWLGIYYGFIFFTAIPLAVRYVYVFIKHYKEMKKVDTVLLLQITILNIIGTAFHSFLAFGIVLKGNLFLDPYSCIASGYLVNALSLARLLTSWVALVDRFCLLVLIQGYRKFRKHIVLALCAASVISSAAVSMLGLPFAFDCYGLRESGTSCSFAGYCSKECYIVQVSEFFLLDLPKFIIPIAFLVLMIQVSNKLQRMVNKSSDGIKKGILRSNYTFFALYICFLVFQTPRNITLLALGRSPRVNAYLHFNMGAIVTAHISVFTYLVESIIILCNSHYQEAVKVAPTTALG